jgi:peptide chain release factor 2
VNSNRPIKKSVDGSSICGTLFDYDQKLKRSEEINQTMAASGFWDDADRAQKLVAELRQLTNSTKPVKELFSQFDDLGVLLEFADEDASGDSETEFKSALAAIGPKLDAAELQAAMSDPADVMGAFVAIQAGEGGTDSADWAAMLLRMYDRWAEDHGFERELLETSPAEEAGIRNATLAIRGDYVFGHLKGETGNHRLIRISPFDSAGRRHTSFAAVDVTPAIDDETVIEVDFATDVREDTYRAGGAGGQHVNKTSSAIRLTHLPTNVVVQCQNERSQHKNRALARKMLIAKLYQLDREKKAKEAADRRGQKSKIGFGGETIRNYVLHPDQFVKDTRTGQKSGNPTNVLNGELDPFIEEYLRWSLTKD